MKTASWVIVSKATGEAVLEVFDFKHITKMNHEKYRAVPIGEWLASLNKKES